MNNLTDIRYVKDLQNCMRIFDSDQGKVVMKFLEQSCGWYESVFDPVNRDMVLLNAGKREVLATIKTLLEFSPETIVTLAKNREEGSA